MNTDTSPVIKHFGFKSAHFSVESLRIAEVNCECQGLQEKMQPIAILFLIFFINVAFMRLNAIKRLQSIRFISRLISQKGILALGIPIKP
jgi:hypothetical protein